MVNGSSCLKMNGITLLYGTDMRLPEILFFPELSVVRVRLKNEINGREMLEN